MKKLFLFLVVLGGFASFLKAQVVTIPDAKFKAYLVNNSNINTNGDTEIQVSEATAFTGKIDCGGRRIVNLTGIEAFVNITQLSCYNNQLNALDVTKNTALITLHCYFNQLTALDVSKNTALIQLLCSNNQLTALDVSKNTNLIDLSCYNNQLGSLDIKNGKNNIMTYMYAYNNPSLACIQVDNVTNANSYTGGGRWLKNETASYSTNCSAMSTTDITKNQIIAYPNPVKDLLNFSEEVSNIKIADISGKVVKQISTTGKSINVANLKNGVYIISAKTKSGKDINQKIIKE